jgi:hypothetical protein
MDDGGKVKVYYSTTESNVRLKHILLRGINYGYTIDEVKINVLSGDKTKKTTIHPSEIIAPSSKNAGYIIVDLPLYDGITIATIYTGETEWCKVPAEDSVVLGSITIHKVPPVAEITF